MSKHTEVPWHGIDGQEVMSADGRLIAECHAGHREERKANAELIVRAVNSHAQLLDAAEAALSAAQRLEVARAGEEHPNWYDGIQVDAEEELGTAVPQLQAAISAARGQK